MELYEDILAQALVKKLITSETAQSIVSDACYQALKQIKDILSDDALEDPECFYRIEEIVCTLESLGTDGGGRHDFG